MMKLAEKLQQLRDRAGMTQAQLAENSGIPLWTVRNYEQGRREPNWQGIIQLADALGVSVDEFRPCMNGGQKNRAPGRPRKARS